MMNIWKGSIIAVFENVYINFEGGKWADHFAEKRVLYLVDSISNNGTIRARNSQGKLKYLSKSQVIEVLKY